MAEIKVSYSELQEDNTDLNALTSCAELKNKLNACYLNSSKGRFSDATEKKYTDKTIALTAAFQRLVRNTITFLSNTGIVFAETDQNAADRVNSVTK